MNEKGEASTAKKAACIIGILVAVGAILIGCVMISVAGATVVMTDTMINMRTDATMMVDYKCDTCGLEGSVVEGTSDTRDGTECGYISGQAVRCKGHYKTRKRKMTEEEHEKTQGDIKNWEKMKAKANPIRTKGILAIVAGILMIPGAVGGLKNKVWGLPVLGVGFILGCASVIAGLSAIIQTYSSY